MLRYYFNVGGFFVNKKTISGALFFILSIILLFSIKDFKGSAIVFPRLTIISTLLLPSVFLFREGLKDKIRINLAESIKKWGVLLKEKHMQRGLFLMAITISYVLVYFNLGEFYISSTVFIFLVTFVLYRISFFRSLIYSTACVLVTHLFFVEIFSVRL